MRTLRTSLTALAALAMLALPAASQITHRIESDIPFPFTIGSTQLPAGKYTIYAADDTDMNAMEIRTADGKTTVAFLIGSAESPNPPKATELEFKKYGDRDFLSKIFEAGNPDGVQVIPSGAELRLIKQHVKPVKHRHPARIKAS